MLVEYKVRPVTRYNVTRFEEGSGSRVVGTYDSEDVAHEVGYALCKAEHDTLGWPEDDERIQYPRRGVKTESSEDLLINLSIDTSALRAQLSELEPQLNRVAGLLGKCGIESEFDIN